MENSNKVDKYQGIIVLVLFNDSNYTCYNIKYSRYFTT